MKKDVNKCEYCNVKSSAFQNKTFGIDESLSIINYGDKYYLRHGIGYYDEYDSYDIESEIEYCPKCGRKLNSK